MDHQVLLAAKPLVTLGAGKRPVTRVSPFMFFQVVLLSEGFITTVTTERPLHIPFNL